MADPHVVTALVRKRSELAGEIDHLQVSLRQRIIDLDNLDATLRLFAPDIDLEDIKPRPLPAKHAGFRGEVSRIILTALRKAGRPMTAQELAQQVMVDRGLNTSDKRLVLTMSKRAGAWSAEPSGQGLREVGEGRYGRPDVDRGLVKQFIRRLCRQIILVYLHSTQYFEHRYLRVEKSELGAREVYVP